ncbi:MAG: helix-turn-helix domain-containing protein [Clostridia bacterium]|nr:helix-turn-helix domain-containing protein [Clostridia bacterium]
MDILTAFSETLSELMLENNLSAETFSKAVKIDRSVIYRYQRRQTLPSLENAIIIADYFNCSLDYLFGRSATNPEVLFKSAPPFSEQFKKLLDENGKTRYRLCRDTHFAEQSIDDWFHGKRLPSLQNIFDLADYFNCSLDYLIGREN